jgi:hypothetical protein
MIHAVFMRRLMIVHGPEGVMMIVVVANIQNGANSKRREFNTARIQNGANRSFENIDLEFFGRRRWRVVVIVVATALLGVTNALLLVVGSNFGGGGKTEAIRPELLSKHLPKKKARGA